MNDTERSESLPDMLVAGLAAYRRTRRTSVPDSEEQEVVKAIIAACMTVFLEHVQRHRAEVAATAVMRL